jgi:hypothetical protein
LFSVPALPALGLVVFSSHALRRGIQFFITRLAARYSIFHTGMNIVGAACYASANILRASGVRH